jgi:hypothetical protein
MYPEPYVKFSKTKSGQIQLVIEKKQHLRDPVDLRIGPHIPFSYMILGPNKTNDMTASYSSFSPSPPVQLIKLRAMEMVFGRKSYP